MSTARPRTRITQKEVAKEANVSQTLVSLVLSGRAVDVAESTRAQIFEAAEKLGYRTKKKEGGARRQKVLAYIRPHVERRLHDEHWLYDSYEEYYSVIQHHLLTGSLAEGYSLIIQQSGSTPALQHWLEEWDVDGVFWHGECPELARWISERYPMVQINRHHVIEADAVSLNQDESILIALEYLRQLGHERILVFTYTEERHNDLQRRRRIAYHDFLDHHNLPHWRQFVSEEYHDKLFKSQRTPDYFSVVEEATLKALEAPFEERPTALLAGDHMALLMMKRLLERGYTFPQDLSIVGIDNISASALVHPALTSLDNNLDELGRQCVQIMMQRIKSPAPPNTKTFITPRLIVRDSAISAHEMRAHAAAAEVSKAT